MCSRENKLISNSLFQSKTCVSADGCIDLVSAEYRRIHGSLAGRSVGDIFFYNRQSDTLPVGRGFSELVREISWH
jgi:hypothetical protein